MASPGTVVLVVLAAQLGDPWKVVSISAYGATLMLLYRASTLCHSLRGPAMHVLRELDHHSIHLLIAGSYTPFCPFTLRGVWSWSLRGTIWGIAAFGSLQEPRPKNGGRFRSLVIYVLMGWAAMVALAPLSRAQGSVGCA